MKRNGAQGSGSDELLNCLSGEVWATGKKTNTIRELTCRDRYTDQRSGWDADPRRLPGHT